MGIFRTANSEAVKIKLDIEKIILIIFFGVLLFIAPAASFDYRIKHEFPYGYASSDSFQHQTRAEAIKDAGNFRHEADYISLGFKDIIGRYPPIIYHLAVIFSYSSGLEVYDSIYLIVFLFVIAGIFTMYLLIRDFNRNVALISLPLMILAFSFPASAGFLLGHWPSLLSQAFLVAFAWCIAKIELKKSYLLIAVMLSSMILTHTSEAVFGVIFLMMFLAFRLIGKNLNKDIIKNVSVAFAVSFIISLYYIIIFQNTWAKAQPWRFAVEPVWQGNPGFYIANFGILLLLMGLGIAFSVLKFREMHASFIFAFAMLFAGFLNYFGFSVRAFQLRFLWAAYLAVFFGFGVYMLLRLMVKKWNIAYSAGLCVVFAVLLLGFAKIPLVPSYAKFSSQGIMDIYHWDSLKWLSRNAEQDSRVYFLYGDIYSQDALLRNSKRVHYQVVPEDFAKALQERKIKRKYLTEMPGDSGGLIAARKGLFKFEYPADKAPQEEYYGAKDICGFDYIVLDKLSRQPVLAQYNLLIASELLKNKNIKAVFENNAVMVLKNSKTGEDCIEERSF